ncbi:MAG: hypothetical protein AB1758_10765, partial [Candidatus Eremiobacterota bacterium]
MFRRLTGVLFLVLACAALALADDRLQAALGRVPSRSDRDLLTRELGSSDPETVQRGMARLVGWVYWGRYDQPPALPRVLGPSRADLVAVMRFVLDRRYEGPQADGPHRMALAWAEKN